MALFLSLAVYMPYGSRSVSWMLDRRTYACAGIRFYVNFSNFHMNAHPEERETAGMRLCDSGFGRHQWQIQSESKGGPFVMSRVWGHTPPPPLSRGRRVREASPGIFF